MKRIIPFSWVLLAVLCLSTAYALSAGSKLDTTGKNKANADVSISTATALDAEHRQLGTRITQCQAIESAQRMGLVLTAAAAPSTGAISAPTNIATCWGWFRADLGVTLNVTTVSAWADQSGQGHHVAQATALNQPLFVSSFLNGQPSLTFNGTTTFLQAANVALNGSNQWTFIFVATRGASQSAYECVPDFYTGGTNRWQLGVGGNVPDGSWAGVNSAVNLGGGTLGTGSYTKTFVKTATVWNVYTNSVLCSTNVADTSNPIAPLNWFNIGAETTTGPTTTRYLGGDVVEVIIYESALSATNQSLVESYLRTRYGHY